MRAALLQAYASAPVVGSRAAAEGSTVVAVTVAPVVPLDLFHTMEAYFTWYPKSSEEASA